VTSITTTVDDLGVKHVTGVDTPTGHIKTKAVVNCAGVWAPYLGEMVGAAVPLVAMYHSYIVTERIEGIENMPNVRDHDLSVYLKLQGDGLSVGGYEHNPIFWEKVNMSSTVLLVIYVSQTMPKTRLLTRSSATKI
jgi:sarcosine dehydrogenase